MSLVLEYSNRIVVKTPWFFDNGSHINANNCVRVGALELEISEFLDEVKLVIMTRWTGKFSAIFTQYFGNFNEQPGYNDGATRLAFNPANTSLKDDEILHEQIFFQFKGLSLHIWDFINMVIYVMENVDLSPNDKRLEFRDWMNQLA